MFFSVFISILYLGLSLDYPITFTTLRNINPFVHPNLLAQSIGIPANNSYSYKFIAFDGWTMNNGYFSSMDLFVNAVNYFGTASKFGTTSTAIQQQLQRRYKVNAFSIYEYPITSQYNAINTANSLSLFSLSNNFDGVSVELNDINCFIDPNLINQTVNWVNNFTTQLRKNLPDSTISFSFPASLFINSSAISGLLLNTLFVERIDFLVIKFYNLQTSVYATEQTLFYTATSPYLKTSVQQISQAFSVPLNKIVVAKPTNTLDTYNGLSTINNSALSTAGINAYNSIGWYAGFAFDNYANDPLGSNMQSVIQNLQKACIQNLNCI